MRMTCTLAVALAVTGLTMAGTYATAQGSPQPSGGNLESAGQFRNIAPTGVTKPPSGAGTPGTQLKPDDRAKTRKDGSSAVKGICIGCN